MVLLSGNVCINEDFIDDISVLLEKLKESCEIDGLESTETEPATTEPTTESSKTSEKSYDAVTASVFTAGLFVLLFFAWKLCCKRSSSPISPPESPLTTPTSTPIKTIKEIEKRPTGLVLIRDAWA
jgi:hypothetical protein